MARTNHQESRSEYWREQVRLAEAFDGTAAAFCRRNNLNPTAFYFWRKRLKDRAVVQSPFVAVEVMPERRRLPEAKWLAEFIQHLTEVAS
jgi:transposase-like protein